MSLSMHSASVPVLIKMLQNARTWLDKADAYAAQKKFDTAVLMQARLAPDMLPFVKQIQIASDHAKGCAARLSGMENPKFEDNEKTFDELRARIDKTIDFLQTVPAEKIDGTEKKEISFTSARAERHFVGDDYLRFYALPNFFFHVTTAYAILRHNGVDLGKTDFLSGATL